MVRSNKRLLADRRAAESRNRWPNLCVEPAFSSLLWLLYLLFSRPSVLAAISDRRQQTLHRGRRVLCR